MSPMRAASTELLAHLPPDPTDAPAEGTSEFELAEQSLLAAFGFGMVAPGAIPGADVCFRSERGPGSMSGRVCADPIHLVADRTTARFDAGESLALGVEDAERYVESLNRLFGDDGVVIEVVEPARWSLTGLDPAALDTWPTEALRARSLRGGLPSAPEAARWRRLLTEAQMCLHAHPANAERVARGLAPVNGIWCWGGAPLPTRGDHEDVVLCSDEWFARGLADMAGVPCRPLDAWTSALSESPARLVIHAPGLDPHLAAALRQAIVERVDARVVASARIETGDRLATDVVRRPRTWWSRWFAPRSFAP